MDIYLIRHGQTDWNAEGRIMGEKDIPINSNGEEQSKKTGFHLKNKTISKILSSPVLRARQTAQIISDILNVPFETDERLREIGFGDWVGQIYDELKKKPDFRTYYDHPHEKIIPNGEIFEEAHERIADIFDEITRSGKDTAIVTHADPIKLFILLLLESPFKNAARIRIDNASVTCIRYKDRPILRYANFAL